MLEVNMKSMFKRALESIILDNELKNDNIEYVAFDLDGTVAEYDQWKGIEHIGNPIPKTIEMIKQYLEKGVKVKFLTARVATNDSEELALVRKYISEWSLQHIGQEIEATCIKDRMMFRLYDDRARQIIQNTGELVK